MLWESQRPGKSSETQGLQGTTRGQVRFRVASSSPAHSSHTEAATSYSSFWGDLSSVTMTALKPNLSISPIHQKEKKSLKTRFWLKTPSCIRQHIFYLLRSGGIERVNQHPTNRQAVLFQCLSFRKSQSVLWIEHIFKENGPESPLQMSHTDNARAEQRSCCPIRAKPKIVVFIRLLPDSHFSFALSSSGDGKTSLTLNFFKMCSRSILLERM